MTGHTLAAPAIHVLEVKHSRFRAQAAAVACADDARDWLQAHSDAQATHNCWAWRIGPAYRFHDDGEPAGTAGKPILLAIDGQGFNAVVVMVTRWFGGIKLGAGGLMRAYGGAAAECLRIAPRQPLIAMAELLLQAPFADVGTLHAALNGTGAEKIDEVFDADGVRLHVRLPQAAVTGLQHHLRDATRGRAVLHAIGDNG